MKRVLLTIYLLCLVFFVSYSQTFNKQNFKFDGICNLENVLNSVDENGNNITVYQCSDLSNSVTIYRIIVLTFKEKITDIDEYYRSLKKEYSTLGTPTSTTLKGKKAIQVVEDVLIEGHNMKQVNVSTFHKSKAITLVLITNSSSFSSLLSNFKNQFSYL